MKSVVYFIFLSILIFTPKSIFSNDPEPTMTSNNVLYADVAGLPSIGYYYSMNYERIIGKRFSVRVGLGYSESKIYRNGGDGFDQGFLAMLNMFTEGNGRFNIGIGASLMYSISEQDNSTDVVVGTPRNGWSVSPAINLSYRYLPTDGNIFFSLGVTGAYLTGGANLSIGYIF